MENLEINIQTIIAIITGILTLIAVFNEKVRGFVLNRMILTRSKAELKKEASDANDAIIETMMARISALNEEFTRLLEVNMATQNENFTTKKENFELKSNLDTIEKEYQKMKEILIEKCKNKCFDV